MYHHQKPQILALEGQQAQPLSIRAKALVFHDPESKQLLALVERLAPSDAPILIRGETGTGKELLARYIHHRSARKGPFLAVNCGAIHDQLAESELFGHEAGSFTGATSQRKGWFESAHGGTLFLDEIGDLPLALQVKLLRVLQEKEVTRVGGRHPIAIDVRVITATNVDLEQAVAAEQFRQDLLFRINIAALELKPLRLRKLDILPLFEHFVAQYSKKLHRNVTPSLSDTARQRLLSYPWPGNIRELENIAHYAMLIAEGNIIQTEHLKLSPLEKNITANAATLDVHASPEQLLQQVGELLHRLFAAPQPQGLWDSLERLIIEQAFEYSHYNQVHTATLLGISRNVTRTLLKRHGWLSDLRAMHWVKQAG